MISKKILDKQLPQLPKEVKFCKKCVMSNQRPRIHWSKDGVCGACTFAEIKKNTDWDKRRKMLEELCDKYRRNDGRYDVIVPASGGKDSARVAYMLKYEYGMHPLTITWAPFEYTPLGYKNFRNFIKVGGFNNLMGWPNAKLMRKLARISFEAVGDPWMPFAYGQAAYAFHIAKAFDIKLVFYGENGEAEYSGDPELYNLRGMPFEIWHDKCLKGITIDNLVEYGLNETDYFTENDYDESDLQWYRLPNIKDMMDKDIQFHFFGYYHHWTPKENYELAMKNTGFTASRERSEGTYTNYASLDDEHDGFHYYLGFIKFGIGRTTADAAHEIRDGNITREEGVELVKRYDGEFPQKYFREFVEYLDITEEEFWKIVDKYRSDNLWEKIKDLWCLKKTVNS